MYLVLRVLVDSNECSITTAEEAFTSRYIFPGDRIPLLNDLSIYYFERNVSHDIVEDRIWERFYFLPFEGNATRKRIVRESHKVYIIFASVRY